MKTSMKWVIVAGLLALSLPTLADHRRHDDTQVSVSLFTPHIGVHYTDVGHSRYGHRHGHGCGHHWDGRVWGRPVPYHRDYRYDGHHRGNSWSNNRHHWKKHAKRHHRRDHHRGDGHRGDGHRDGHRSDGHRSDGHRDGGHRGHRD